MDALARGLAREAGELESSLDAEVWASQLLGVLWSRRSELPIEDFDEYALALGEPVIRALDRISTQGAGVALHAIAEVDDGELGRRALERARRRSDLPAWVGDLGEAEIVAAAVMRERVFDDAITVFLQSRHADGQKLAVGVLIDHNLGDMAKDVLLADSIDQVAATVSSSPTEGGEVSVDPIDPGVAAGMIYEALELTDMTWQAPVGEDFAGLRALALMRCDETWHVVRPAAREEMPQSDRDALRDEFLAAPEGRGFAADGNAAFVAALAIDFCADYVDGRPLRWSPVVVELFMADWVPRKVMTDPEMLAELPAALEAWVRFAGRKSSIPAWAITLTCEAIPRWRQEMLAHAEDPAAGGPAKQFLSAAHDAGIDLALSVNVR